MFSNAMACASPFAITVNSLSYKRHSSYEREADPVREEVMMLVSKNLFVKINGIDRDRSSLCCIFIEPHKVFAMFSVPLCPLWSRFIPFLLH